VRAVLTPGGVFKNGRCVEWKVSFVPRFRHVLDYTPPIHFPSKHARGRIRPRTKAEAARAARLRARFVQISKTLTVDANRMAAMVE
jgi:hypothetical protein